MSVDVELLRGAQAYLAADSERRGADRNAREAWESFFSAYDPTVRAAVASCRVGRADFEDRVQDAWMELISKLPSFRLRPSRGDFRSWVYTLARRRVLAMLRRKSRPCGSEISLSLVHVEEPAGPASAGDAACAVDEQRRRVRAALETLRNQLSPQNIRILELRWLEGHSPAEIAERVGLSPQQVWYRQNRMKPKLRSALEAQLIS